MIAWVRKRTSGDFHFDLDISSNFDIWGDLDRYADFNGEPRMRACPSAALRAGLRAP